MKRNFTKLLIAVIAMLSVSLTAIAEDTACTHQWNDWNVKKNATISKKGLQTHECVNCGKTETKTIEKLKPFVKFSKKKIEVTKSQKLKLKVTFAKGDSVKKWKTSNKKIVTVSKSGKITAKKKGTAKITVTMKSGKKATCTVKVVIKKKVSNKDSSSNSTSVTSNKIVVYWVANGEVYHSTDDCASLKRSKYISSGSMSDCPKSRPCKLCH